MTFLKKILSFTQQFDQKKIFILIGLIPVIAVLSWSINNYCSLQKRALFLYQTYEKFYASFDTRMRRQHFLRAFLEADSEYMGKTLLAFPLNQSYLSLINPIVQNLPFSHDKKVQKKLLQLSQQTLSFQKKTISSSSLMKETVFLLEHPVTLTGKSLEKILRTVEGISIEHTENLAKRPQLFFLDFSITKNQEGFYQCHMEILQRDFFKKRP
ncbi:MAG: hypothetical protein JW769_03415 [Parachlamydiales bacterium]|nr:hypothetical protein [Parachlamydiales bacterium]